MDNRWHMNRMGFVNFWLYDEETFSFADGKLLLRGQNGSGKSITTQSFIPFILDGDRSPSRLDPFGSNDRKMDYYFLGEDGKDESTGYLFLEFKKEKTDQYRTIGIGQRAQKGKPMSFWGFVLLDGRRIGYDMLLYRAVGSKKIPLTKQEIKQELGENNAYTEVQREYLEFVNKYIFGFPNAEQYQQFIRLLIKVRAPKLSKEFKPTKVYEILNDSLPSLTDEDLRAMVEAMEKMDDIQSRLESLKDAFKEIQIIRNEYLRYNLYMLGKKAQAYVDEKKRTDETRLRLEQEENTLREQSNGILSRQEEMGRLTEEIRMLENEKDVLHMDDVDRAIDKLHEAEKGTTEAEEDKKKLECKIQQSREKIRIHDGKLRTMKEQIDEYSMNTEKILQELEDENETLAFEFHQEVQKIEASQNWRMDIQRVTDALRKLEQSVEKGLAALKELKAFQEKWDREEETLQSLILKKQDAEIQGNLAESLEIECRDQLIESFYTLTSQNQELKFSKQDLTKMDQMLQKYQNLSDAAGIRDCFYENWQNKNQVLESRRLELINQNSFCLERMETLIQEIENIKRMRTPVPSRKQRTIEARAVLSEKGIPFLPFYEAVEFTEDLDQADKDHIEGQLEDAGLLDALVIPKENYDRAKAELKGLSDVLIHMDGKEGKPFPYLVAADTDMADTVRQILCQISENSSGDGKLVLSKDGYFRNGILEGYSHSGEEASYVGAIARKRKIERMLQEKQAEFESEREKSAVLEQELNRIKQRLDVLLKERNAIPSFADLDQALDLVRSCKEEIKKITADIEKQETVVSRLKDECKKSEQNVLKLCKALPYSRNIEEYQDAKQSVQSYKQQLNELEHILLYSESEKSKYIQTEELIQMEEEKIDSDDESLRKAVQKAKELSAQIDEIQAFLNNPETKGRTERLKTIKKDLEEKNVLVGNHKVEIGVSEKLVETLAKEIEGLKGSVVQQAAKEEKLKGFFIEELNLGLIMKEESGTIFDIAVKAKDLVRSGDRNKSETDIVSALQTAFHSHLSALTRYGMMMEEWFEGEQEDPSILRKRWRISATWNGKKLFIDEFYGVIKESIEGTELLIQQKDRELFEGILADTLSRKLSNRIRESRMWIKDMSALMQKLDTSMALTFSLEWKPKTAEEEQELDTQELEKILARDRELLTPEDIEKVSLHFRAKIYTAKRNAEDNGEAANYLNLVRDALDYRKWFEFRMYYYRNGENKKELTNGAFNRFSGGEKAMAMYVPLFAAVSAQYKKAQIPDYPRIIALDEAFAGVDDKNISSMFELVQKLEFDYIMNSQVLWGCYETVKSLRIAELLKPGNADMVVVITYYWNGYERVLDEQ